MSLSKELVKKYKDVVTKIGIYSIKNLKTGKLYLGYAANIEARINRHKFELKYGSEQVNELLSDYKKYGEDAFEYSTVAEVKQDKEKGYDYKSELVELYLLWLEELNPYDERGYNDREEKIKR